MPSNARSPRLALTAALLAVLGLSGPLLGGDAMSPAREARPVSTVEGVISQVVSLPTPGSKPVIYLLDGLLAVDTANAKVQDFYGESLGVDALRVGGRVVASVTAPATPGQPLAAQVLLVAPTPHEGLLYGAVEAVDVGAGTFRLLGTTVRTTSATKWSGGRPSPAGDPASGAVSGIQGLSAGDLVMVVVRAEGGAVVAVRVQVIPSATAPDLVRISGTVKAIGATSWTVTAEGRDVALAVNERTRIVGDPQIGDRVEVLAQADAAGALTALAISKATITPPPDPALDRFRGTVKGIASAAWIITRDGKDVTVAVTAETRITGSPKVGDAVEVLAKKESSGALVALLIANVGTVPTVPEVQRVSGKVKSTSATAWVITTAAGDVTLAVSAETKLVGDPKVGDDVEALALKDAAGALHATVITRVPAGPVAPGLTSFTGTVKSVKDSVWTVNDVTVVTSRKTVIVGDPHVEDRVRVVGQRMSAGSDGAAVFMAVEIAKL